MSQHRKFEFGVWLLHFPLHCFELCFCYYVGFLCGLAGEESACNVGDLGLIPELGRSPGEGNGNPLQYSCQENPMDTGAWWVTGLWGHKESDTLSD